MSKFNFLWLLEGTTPVHEPDAIRWAEQMEQLRLSGSVQVGQTDLGRLIVSTVFLGLDHGIGGKVPMLFESMVWHGDRPAQNSIVRYSTWDEALEGHQKIVASLRSHLESESPG